MTQHISYLFNHLVINCSDIPWSIFTWVIDLWIIWTIDNDYHIIRKQQTCSHEILLLPVRYPSGKNNERFGLSTHHTIRTPKTDVNHRGNRRMSNTQMQKRRGPFPSFLRGEMRKGFKHVAWYTRIKRETAGGQGKPIIWDKGSLLC